MRARLFARLRIVIKYCVLVSLSFPGFRHWLHQTLSGYVHEFAIYRLIEIHSQEFGIILHLLVVRIILLRLFSLAFLSIMVLLKTGAIIKFVFLFFFKVVLAVIRHDVLIRYLILKSFLSNYFIVFVAIPIVLHLHNFSGQIIFLILAMSAILKIDKLVQVLLPVFSSRTHCRLFFKFKI